MEGGKYKFLKVNVLSSLVDCICSTFCTIPFTQLQYSGTRSVLCLLGPACLRVSPDRSQFFRYDSVSLNCSSQVNASGWRVKRRTPGGGVRPCTSGWGSAFSGSTCTIRKTYPSDSGEYWCQSTDGEKSNGVNITVTGTANRQEL